jgi:predicted cupin superfamily sugar epimerase
MRPTTKQVIEHFEMTTLPVESTFFVKTYRSKTSRPDGTPDGSAIIALYSDDPRSCSLFHRLKYEEVWHFYAGDPIRLVLLYPDKTSKEVILGLDFTNGELIQFTVPENVWQAGEIVKGGEWGLFGCTMSPGFTGEIFEGGYYSDLINDFADRAEDIKRLAVPAEHEKNMPKGYEN